MAPKKDYTPQQMGLAIEAVKKGEKIATAAKRFSVPRITLYNKVMGKSPVVCSMGPKTILTKYEEDILVNWLFALADRHFPITKEHLLESVQKIVVDQGKPNPFTDNKPGKKWFQAFLRRHPEVVEKTTQNIARARDDIKEEHIQRWFTEVAQYLQSKNLKNVLDDPTRIFNADESVFFLSPKILTKRGDNNLHSLEGAEKENLSVLITGNAAGILAPPMIVYSYERISSNITASVPENWSIGRSKSGWMCSSTFFEYVSNIFNPWLEQQHIKKPIVFFLDGQKSHLTLHLSNFCSENGIELIALYPNSTHILQPMDLALFRPLKVAWKKEVTQWKKEHLGETLKKEHFAPLLQNAINSLSPECVQNGFRASGLHPFGADYIDMTKIRDHQEIVTRIDSRQSDFINYLESEIIKLFSLEKLNLFNSLYYKDRTTLERSLPGEDVTLYILWAKNKQMSLINDPRSEFNNNASSSNSISIDRLPSTSKEEQGQSLTTCTERLEGLSVFSVRVNTKSVE